MADTPTVIGINFGTSYSSIAYINNEGRADCIANEDGDRQIPAVVGFSGDEEVVGAQAYNQIVSQAKNTVNHFRALLGKSFSEVETLPGSAAEVVEKDGKPGYEIPLESGSKFFTVKEITTKYLRRLRESAENFLGRPITGAVMSIPSYFTQAQRDELKVASKDAGINVLQFIHESAAAALTYSTTETDQKDKTIVVADLGAHSLDVTLINVRSGMFTILATAHDTKLGGSSFDELLINHFNAEFKKKAKIDITGNKKALAKLRAAVEVTKRTLSSSNSAPCSVESLAEGIDFHSNINRMRFEIMANKVIGKYLETIEAVLKKGDLDPSEVDEVILAGGASRMPKIAAKLRDIFTGENVVIHNELESDEVVANGCAIQGQLIADLDAEDIEGSIHPVLTLTPHTSKHIGIVNHKNEFITIIPRDTPLPVRRTVEFGKTAEATQVYLALWEGKHEIVKAEIPKEANGAADDEDEDKDVDLDDTPEITTSVVISPETLLAELVLDDVSDAKVECQITIDAEEKMTAILRERKAGAKVVKVEVAKKA